ncbi:MAG: SprT family zinc-dependent metalloprotease [Clostridia bacterium]|nr:SprT family zinc-dependent metalloprotease [Clostridia bacterium]
MMPEPLGFEYSLIRSDRRTLSVKITRDARVEVRAPKRMGVREIEKFLFEKRLWIQKHLSQTEANQQSAAAFLPDENSKLLLLGREYPLAKTDGKGSGFDGERFFLPSSIPREEVVPALREIYRAIAKQYIPERTAALAGSFSESVNSVKINSARTRWGSCSSKGNINFSLFLVMAPPSAVDYCIIHELSHLKHMDHSKAFWQLVESRDPEYKAHIQELKKLQMRLAGEQW